MRESIQAEIIRDSLAESRHLALAAGSAISPDRADAASVLASTQPVLGFLTGGDPDDVADQRARRRAVRRHLDNLRHSAASALPPGTDPQALLRGTDPQAFLEQVRVYYGFLVRPLDPGTAFTEITGQLDDPEKPGYDPAAARAQLLELVRDSGEQGISSYQIWEQLQREGFCVQRETVARWRDQFVREGLIVRRAAAAAGALSRRFVYRAAAGPGPGEQA
jgi:hypothetical protein